MLRRKFLCLTGGACLAHAGMAKAQTQFPPEEGLDALARRTGRRFGFAVQPVHADQEPVRSLLQQHAGVITAELAMKWKHMSNLLGAPEYRAADQVAALAGHLGAALRGHTLAWHQSTPGYLANATPEQFVTTQTAHLQSLMQRFKGRIHTWDVLNEVIDTDAAGHQGMRQSVLSKLWRTDRYPALFELARAADPSAKLAYNDYGMEQDEPWCEARRGVLLRLLEAWVKRGTPLDVMGLQAHLDLSRRFSAHKLLRFFDELQALGLSIQITELDVRDASNPGGLAARDEAVAALYKDFMDACLSHPAVEMVVMWNVTDGDSWINRWNQGQRRADGLPQRPLLFDSQGLPKPAFHAVAASLGDATVKFDMKKARNV
jgi:endo-1,4-beta-xylanase